MAASPAAPLALTVPPCVPLRLLERLEQGGHSPEALDLSDAAFGVVASGRPGGGVLADQNPAGVLVPALAAGRHGAGLAQEGGGVTLWHDRS